MGFVKKINKNETKTLIKKITGILLIVLGVIGIFLPLLQGILLIAIGIALYEDKSIKDIKKSSKNLLGKIKRILNKRYSFCIGLAF